MKKMIQRLSPHFNLSEFTKSQIAETKFIKLVPNFREISNYRALANCVLEPIREMHGNLPVTITSGFRNEVINKLAGGENDSHHLAYEGYAACDFVIEGWTPEQIVEKVITSSLRFHQLIDCVHYVHVSHFRNKCEALKKEKSGKYSRLDVIKRHLPG